MEQRDEFNAEVRQAREIPGLSGISPEPPPPPSGVPGAPETPPESAGGTAFPGAAQSGELPPREVVEVYRQPRRQAGARERIFLYRRPLPERMQPRRQTLPPLASLPASSGRDCAKAWERELEPRALRRRRRKGILRFAAGFLVLALLAGVSLAVEQPRNPAMPKLPIPFQEERGDRETEEISIPGAPAGMGGSMEVLGTHDQPLTAQEIYQQVNPSVVLVLTQLRDGSAVGTGVIFTEDGYIVTNCHVLEGGEDCQVILDTGEFYDAKYVGSDADSDLAVLKINARNLPAAQFGSSDGLTVGDRVYAIGNPLGIELRGTMTDGIVSAIERDVWVDHRTMTLIQTNAALNSGNSGGPLINIYGQVVGINVIKMTSDYSNVEGLGFAIPSAYMERIVNDLLDWGEVQPEPVLGLSVMQVSTVLPDGEAGLEVVELTPDSAADRAGIQVGDYALRAGGEDLRTSRDLLRVRRRCHLGDQLPMTLWRDGQRVEVTLELAEALTKEPETVPWYVE